MRAEPKIRVQKEVNSIFVLYQFNLSFIQDERKEKKAHSKKSPGSITLKLKARDPKKPYKLQRFKTEVLDKGFGEESTDL